MSEDTHTDTEDLRMARVVRLQELAWEMQAQGRLDAARQACLDALGLLDDSLDAANLLTDLAEIEGERADLLAALAHAVRARQIEDASGEGFESADGAQLRLRTLRTLGNLRRALGDLPGAEVELRACLDLAERVFGAESDEVAAACNDLGVLAKEAGRFDEGRALYERSLAIVTARDGPDCERAGVLLHNIGGLLHARGDLTAAEPPARRAWELSRARLGEDDPRTLADAAAYAAILEGLGRLAESETMQRRVLSVQVRLFGDAHSEVAASLHNLAAICEAAGRLEEAESSYRRALAIRETLLGRDAVDTALTCNNLGALLLKTRSVDEATRLFERACATLAAALPPGHPHRTQACVHLEAARQARRQP
jgi:tetratricopeptide (TPR) repeat protein